MEKQKNRPKIRFPEFTEVWCLRNLSPYLVEYIERVSSDTTIPILTSSRNGLFLQKDYFDNREISNEGEYGVVPRGYFTYRHMSDDSTFKFNINNICDRGAVSKEYPVFTTKGLDPKFLQIMLNSSVEFKKFAISQKQGGTRTRLYFKKLSQLELTLPSYNEQVKIASFLTLIDCKIDQMKRKESLLRNYKKGVMQLLFSKKIKFNDKEKVYSKSEEVQLGEICKITTGKLDANAMTDNGEYRFYTCAKEFCKIDNYAFDTEALLISGNGANVGYIHYYNGKFNAYQRTYVLDGFKHNIQYVKYFLEHFLPLRILNEKKEGNTPYIVLSTLSEMPILIPSLAEQQKIASFLSALDDKIAQTSLQIEKMQLWKKGLLQQMFV